jgi:MoaA/NifB/PqqE/SkfB family radical SAM enzyme
LPGLVADIRRKPASTVGRGGVEGSGFGFYPQLVRLDATWRCNLNCKHCQTAMFRGSEHPNDLTTGEVLDLFQQLSQAGTKAVGLLGGEPLLRADLPELLLALASHDIKATITTNGLRLPALADCLVNDARASVAVSLDGPDARGHEAIRGRTTFSKAVAGLESALSARRDPAVEIGISSVVHRGNIANVCDFLDLARDLGVDYIILAAVHPVGSGATNWDSLMVAPGELMEAGRKLAERIVAEPSLPTAQVNFFTPAFRRHLSEAHGLRLGQIPQLDRAGFYECYIQCDGRVFPSQKCSEMVPEVLAGAGVRGMSFLDNSIRARRFADIWNGPDFGRYRDLVMRREHLAHYRSCSTCEFSSNLCLPTAGAFLAGESDPQPICVEAAKASRAVPT